MKGWLNSLSCTALIAMLVFFSCDKGQSITTGHDEPEKPTPDLPTMEADTAGIHSAHILGSTKSPFGYYIYLPPRYAVSDRKYPLLVFLHGIGERGNSRDNPDTLKMVLENGPPHLIKIKKWSPPCPMVVASPQCHLETWPADSLHNFIAYILDTYRIDNPRIYLTGLSLGGRGTLSYVETFGDTGYIAAAVPVAAWGNPQKADKFMNMPVWAFHGEADSLVNITRCITMITVINSIDSGLTYRARLTVFPEVAHDCWSITYDSSGMGLESSDYDPFDRSIYEWLLQFKKDEHSTSPNPD